MDLIVLETKNIPYLLRTLTKYHYVSHDGTFNLYPLSTPSTANAPSMATQVQGPGLMSRTPSLPTIVSYDNGSLTDSDPSSSHKFPHTRAQLSAIARQYKPLESFDTNTDEEIREGVVVFC